MLTHTDLTAGETFTMICPNCHRDHEFTYVGLNEKGNEILEGHCQRGEVHTVEVLPA